MSGRSLRAMSERCAARSFRSPMSLRTFEEARPAPPRAQVNDSSGDGGGGDQCCWTTAHVRVIVK